MLRCAVVIIIYSSAHKFSVFQFDFIYIATIIASMHFILKGKETTKYRENPNNQLTSYE